MDEHSNETPSSGTLEDIAEDVVVDDDDDDGSGEDDTSSI